MFIPAFRKRPNPRLFLNDSKTIGKKYTSDSDVASIPFFIYKIITSLRSYYFPTMHETNSLPPEGLRDYWWKYTAGGVTPTVSL